MILVNEGNTRFGSASETRGRPMLSPGFLLRRWPKRHEHLFEECLAHGRVLPASAMLSRAFAPPDLFELSSGIVG